MPPANPENVETIPFTGPGEDPAVLVGLRLISVSQLHQYPLILSFRQYRRAPRDVQIHSSVVGRFFNVEVCDLLREHLPKASDIHPLKVIAAAFGSKKVEYSAPYSLQHRDLFRKKQVDEYKLIGLQLEGMNRMGWIWAEDLDRSFEEGQIKASVYIPTEIVPTTHRPSRMRQLSFEDLKKTVVLKRASNMRGGTLLIESVLGDRARDEKPDLSPSQVAELERMVEDVKAGRMALPSPAIGARLNTEEGHGSDELSDLSELSDHDSIFDTMDLDTGS
ncbi:hypothetical protein TWF718_009314 [Orbilia javanica]|uniref:Uncharacterized protein n=1 Tax=Orbilia javanica TaxID=47235 RepID=A0AAN8MNC0_9PEZI